ncbi:hypothetical protein CYMTET_6443 [Cymbomonas tetramitiformis]|uniref:Uncharacterized protein n=1 Tax=Cymbomonas tetramitiformis TaxID=36881 RepID=A0AAE0GXJ4_9CHLO|nr:hypothetical protein CYMTET_6443 [Cymbomonas tetramitiformis]
MLSPSRSSEAEIYELDGLRAWVEHATTTGPPAGVARAPEDPMAMHTSDDRAYQSAIKNESSLLRDIGKLVDDLPEFPSDHFTKGRAMDDLEEFSVAVIELLEHMTVIAALSTPSFRREVQGRNQLSIFTLLAVDDQDLQFMGDLALSVDITTDALKRLKSELLSSRQRAEEKTGAFYTRVTTRTATVNFVAEVVRGCGKVTKLELPELFWGGLRHSVQVGSKLVDIWLDTSHPEQWEGEQRRLGRSDTSAILKVRSVATEIETAKVAEDAVLHDTIPRKVA